MKKVGFIDYYLDEWHANNYPAMIKEHSQGRYEVCYAYGEIDNPIGGMTNKEWAEKYSVQLLGTVEEVIEKSDMLIVLSPDNPEMHEALTDLPLKSGKLTYVDKTFAPDKETAMRIFENAERHHTPCYSSSALRFSEELENIEPRSVYRIYSEGPGTYEIESIHQIEPIVRLMGCPARRIMALGDVLYPSMLIEFEDGRQAQLHQCENAKFQITVVDEQNYEKKYPIRSDFFGLFIDNLIRFFDTGIVPVPHVQTVDVIHIREAGLRALQYPFQWIEL